MADREVRWKKCDVDGTIYPVITDAKGVERGECNSDTVDVVQLFIFTRVAGRLERLSISEIKRA